MSSDDNSETVSALPDATGPLGGGDRVVQAGECLESIALETGFYWQTLWDHGGNAALKKARKYPTALLPGDQLFIPVLGTKEESRPPEARHRFKRKGIPSKLILTLLDKEGKPRAGKSYRLIVDGVEKTGSLDGSGKLNVPISASARNAELIIADEDYYTLNLRHLDPSTEPTGVQARLRNLGYYAGELDGVIEAETRIALACFQRDHSLDPTGSADSTTLKKLEEIHGG